MNNSIEMNERVDRWIDSIISLMKEEMCTESDVSNFQRSIEINLIQLNSTWFH